MPVAIDADVSNFDRVRPDIANQSWPHEKTVAVVLNSAPIIVVERACLNCVALPNEVLAKDIRDVHVLRPPVESIQATIRVFLELRKIRSIELITIVVERTKDARSEIVL